MKFGAMNNKDIIGFSSDALRILNEHHWPGNVRELENVIERAVILERSSHITVESLMLFQQQPEPVPQNLSSSNGGLKGELTYTEKEIILAALERNNWRRKKTAEELNINRVTLYNKMKKYEIME